MKISIVGSGKIAQEVLKSLHEEAPEFEFTSIYAHSNWEKASLIGDQYGIDNVYNNYGQLLKEDRADFIYIGLVNTAHYEFARQALLAGRNVILEKPFTSTYEEAVDLADLARKNKLWIFEAVTTLHLPNFILAKKYLKDIAPVRIVQSNYSQYSSRYDMYLQGKVMPAFNPQLGGGALNDLNIYNINVVVGLFGEPKSLNYYANRGFNGVDTSGILTMNYPDKAAVCVGAKDSASPSSITIQGEKGTLLIPSAPNEVSKVVLIKNGERKEWQENKYKSRLVHEFKDFERIWSSGDYDTMNAYLDTSLSVMHVLENAHKI